MASAAELAIILTAKDEATATFDKLKGTLGGVTDFAKTAVVGGFGLAAAAVAGVGVAGLDMANDLDNATDLIATKLGITKDEASAFESTMKGVFANNFGNDFADIADAVVLIEQNLTGIGELTQAEMQAAAEGAFALRDAFGIEVAESTDAAATLMEQFGLTSQEAFDFIAAGIQQGLNRSGDFLDTINEYSTQFGNAGTDAGQFFSLLESGLQGGMLGTDRAADAFKEFRVRIQDGSETTSAALGQIGIDAEVLAQQMADGSVTAADAFQLVVDRLGEVEDENVRMQAGVGLLGTQFEDLGTAAALALDLTGTKLADLAGSTESLNQQYDNFGSLAEGAWRQVLIAVEPLTSELLSLANEAMPQVSAFMTDTLTPAIELVALWLKDNLPAAIQTASDFWTGTLQPAIDTVVGFINNPVMPVIESLRDLIVSSNATQSESTNETWLLIRQIIEETVAIVQEVLAGLQAFWQEHGDTIQRIAEAAWSAVQTIIDGALKQVVNILQLALAVLRGDWSTALDELKQIWSTSWNTIKKVLEDLGPVLVDLMKQAVRGMINAVTSVDWGSVGAGIKDGILGGLSGLKEAAEDRIKGALGGAKDSVVGFFRGGSPMLVWAEDVGLPIAQGIATGIIWGTDEVVSATVNLVDTAMKDGQQRVKDGIWAMTSELDDFLLGLGVGPGGTGHTGISLPGFSGDTVASNRIADAVASAVIMARDSVVMSAIRDAAASNAIMSRAGMAREFGGTRARGNVVDLPPGAFADMPVRGVGTARDRGSTRPIVINVNVDRMFGQDAAFVDWIGQQLARDLQARGVIS